MPSSKALLPWLCLPAIVYALIESATSPLLQWREPVYIAASFAGIAGLCILLFQPLLAIVYLPGMSALKSRRLHRWLGMTLLVLVVIHVALLWITSPPDVIDALLFVSPTPFSLWGVIALWSVVAASVLFALRSRLPLRPQTWRSIHQALAIITVAGTVVHVMRIDGAMGLVSKTLLCALVVLISACVFGGLFRKRVLRRRSDPVRE